MAKSKIGSAENLRQKDVQIALRMSRQLNDRVEVYAKRHQLKFSDALRRIIEAGLDIVE